jgi:hypothetical protein
LTLAVAAELNVAPPYPMMLAARATQPHMGSHLWTLEAMFIYFSFVETPVI